MTLQECYDAMGGNFADVMERMPSERLIKKFVLKFLDDPSFDLLCSAMAEKNCEEAFRAAHTIKGICQNLGFAGLLTSSSLLSDALRHGWTPEADGIFEQVKEDHTATVTAIRAYKEECGD